MSSIFAEAHMRLAALPTRRITREPAERLPTSLTGYPSERSKPGPGTPADSPLRRRKGAAVDSRIAADVERAKARPKARKAPTAFTILPDRSNRWGFVRGEDLVVADDGGSWAGATGQYAGAASTHYVYVRFGLIKASVSAARLSRPKR